MTLWFSAILVVILGAFSLFVYFRQAQVLRTETAARLVAQQSRLADYYQSVLHSMLENEAEEGEAGAPPSQALPLLQASDQVAVIGPGGQALQQTSNLSPEELSSIYQAWAAAGGPSEPFAYTSSQPDREEVRYLVVGSYLDPGQGLHAVLLVGSPLDPERQLPRLAFTLGVVFAATVLGAFGGGYWLATRAMRPVRVITRAAREIGEKDLDRRLLLGRDDELGKLADTFDRMLDRLQGAFERQRQFTADASHELRTPLAVIAVEAERALEHARTPDEYQDALRTIRSEGEWMGRLVDQLLTLARMDSGREIVKGEKVDLSEVAVDVIERLGELARRNGVSLQTGVLEESRVWADRALLTHMLANLIENGLKYARGGEAKVIVEAGTRERGGRRWAWVQVSDNGPGIPDEHLAHVFDRFYRADSARTQTHEGGDEESPGSGLGLAIVRSVAGLFEGEVEVSSEVGRGTIFTVWLPEVSAT